MFSYKYALVCEEIPKSLADGLSLSEHSPVDLKIAQEEHKQYLQCLKTLGITLIEVSADDQYPDCIFVEDIALAVGNRVFITYPGASSRRGEVKRIKEKFEEIAKELNLEISEVQNSEEAFIDGGDVCYTGRELIVGISKRTNQKGIDFAFIK